MNKSMCVLKSPNSISTLKYNSLNLNIQLLTNIENGNGENLISNQIMRTM